MRSLTHSDEIDRVVDSNAWDWNARYRPGFNAWFASIPDHTEDCDDDGCKPGCAQGIFFGKEWD